MIKAKMKHNPKSKDVNRLLKHLKSIKELRFGYFDGKTHSATRTNTPVFTYAALMFWHEYGLGNYPARPFMQAASAMLRDNIRQYNTQIKKVISDVGGAAKNQDALGKTITEDIKQLFGTTFTYGGHTVVNNSVPTIIKKGADDPLVETGELRDNFEYRVGEGVDK